MRVVVAGVPGVGKSTVMNGVADKAGYKVVNFGDIMFEVASSKGLVEHRDNMRKLDVAVQKELQLNAAKKLGEMDDILIDTHMTIKTPSGYLPGLPQWVLEAIKPNMIVLVETSAEEIYERRAGDASRVRDPDSPDMIQEHMDMNRMAAMAASVMTGAVVKTISNPAGMVDVGVKEFLKALNIR